MTGVNPYHLVQDELDGWFISLNGDLCRSLKQKNYFIVETNAQTIGWASSSYQFPPWDGQLRLNVYGHLASGADMVAYWHWHSTHAGNEMFWKGVLSHDLEPNRVYGEMCRVGNELKKIGPNIVNLRKANRVALLYSVDSYHGLEFMPFNKKNGVMSGFENFEATTDYLTVFHQFHKAFYDLNIGVDIVFPQSTNFGDFGKGTLTYEGTVLSDGLQKKVLLNLLALARLTGPDQELPAAVKVKHGANREGRKLHYYLNYSGGAQEFQYPYGAGKELLTNRAVSSPERVRIEPWDLAIILEAGTEPES